MQKYNKNEKQTEKDQQTIKPFDKLYRKSLQDNKINKSEYECLCKVFIVYVEGKKNVIFSMNMNTKTKMFFFE